MYSLGIDIGTSGVRSAVVNEEGQVVSAARTAHLPQNQDAIDAELWWQAVYICLRSQVEAMKQRGLDPKEISDIAVDGTSGSMVLIDENACPVSPALMYNSGGYTHEAERISTVAPDHHITKGPNSSLARLMRLSSIASGADRKHLAHQADFIFAKLTGIVGHSDYNNTLKTGFDLESQLWPSWFDQLISDNVVLPKVHPAGRGLFPLRSTLASQLGLSPNAIVHAGTTDSIAAFLAVGDFKLGTAVTSLGTTLAVKLLSDKRIDDPAVGLYSHKVGDFWLVGGASNSGGGVLLDFFTAEELAEISTNIDPDVESGLDYYPLSRAGERFPINDPLLRPRLSPRPNDDSVFLKGLFEGIAKIEDLCYKLIEKRGGPSVRCLYTAGGGSASKEWRQIRARILGIEPKIAAQYEASVGTAILCNL